MHIRLLWYKETFSLHTSVFGPRRALTAFTWNNPERVDTGGVAKDNMRCNKKNLEGNNSYQLLSSTPLCACRIPKTPVKKDPFRSARLGADPATKTRLELNAACDSSWLRDAAVVKDLRRDMRSAGDVTDPTATKRGRQMEDRSTLFI